jgi:peptidoglycan/xylan/chitin deacetylase (PgdA/CDA1 family)/glycosyltransferase involved in cell wall biosynthesis
MSAAPQLSVLIATHNRSQLLRRCLRTLEAQDAPPESFEVIVADDGSDDGTPAVVEAMRTPFGLRVLSLEKVGKSEALNAGIRAAAGSVCLCIDDDIVASPELVSGHLAAHLRDAMTVGLGKLIQQPPDSDDWYAEAFARAWNDHYARLAKKEEPSWTDCYGGNVSAARELLLKIGGFEAKFPIGEDYEIGFRLRENGGVLTYLPRAAGVHDDQKPGRKLIRDARRQGISYVGLVERHPAMMPKLFGWFSEPTLREVLVRRLLLAFRVPPRVLAAAVRLLPGEGRKQIGFHFLSRYAFWLGVRETVDREKWLRITRRVPILMYHGFGDGEKASRFVISRRSFARQMRVLALLRYRPITFEQLTQRLRECRLPPRRALVITIDDGYRDNLEVAHPVLARHDFPATLFLVSQKLGIGNDWDGEPPLGERPTLSVEQARQLRAAGHEIGAHTRNHCSLTDADDATQREEIAGCKRELEEALGAPVTTFAYPYGRRDEHAVAVTEAAGFLGACTTHPDLARFDEDPVRLPRLEIRGTDSLRTFLRKLWLGGP